MDDAPQRGAANAEPFLSDIKTLRQRAKEERADDMHDLLVAHQGQPMLPDNGNAGVGTSRTGGR